MLGPKDNDLVRFSLDWQSLQREQNVPDIYNYDLIVETWQTKPGLSQERRRGGAAAALHGRGDIHLVAGKDRDGHSAGKVYTRARFDTYNIDNNEQWTVNLTNARRSHLTRTLAITREAAWSAARCT